MTPTWRIRNGIAGASDWAAVAAILAALYFGSAVLVGVHVGLAWRVARMVGNL